MGHVGVGSSCRGGVGHIGWGGSCKGGLGVSFRVGELFRDGLDHLGVGWVI